MGCRKASQNIAVLFVSGIVEININTTSKRNVQSKVLILLGKKNISYIPLVQANNIILPPLHKKLELMKNFVKAMDFYGIYGEGFLYLKTFFPTLSEASLKECILVGPDIQKVMKDMNFIKKLNASEKNA